MTAKRRGNRAVIYDRTSVRDDASMEEHVKRCKSYCTSQKLKVVEGGVLTDRGVSGFHDRARPRWVKVKEMVASGQVDVVVFFALSRIERNVARTFQFAELCEANGVTFVSVTEDINTGGPYGRVILAVMAAFAEVESLAKRERALMGREMNEREGYYSGGSPGFGFRSVKDGDHWRVVVEAPEAEMLRDAAYRVLNGKAGVQTIAKEWNAAGVKTVGGRTKGGGKEWTPSHVRMVLEAERNVPGILAASTHRKLLRLFEGRKTGVAPERYLLTGLLRCGKCGAKMVGRAGRYICKNGPDGSRVHLSAVTGPVDEYIIAQAEERPERKREHVPDPAAPLIKEREGVLQEMRDLGANLDLPDEVLQARADALKAKLDDIEQQIEEGVPEAETEFHGDGDIEFTERDDFRAWLDTLVKDAVLTPASKGASRFDPTRLRLTWR
jgi:site-specific DNA recombinase